MTDHDLMDDCCYAGGVMDHGPGPWPIWALSDWLTRTKRELKCRGLLKDAEWARKAMRKDRHVRRKLKRSSAQ